MKTSMSWHKANAGLVLLRSTRSQQRRDSRGGHLTRGLRAPLPVGDDPLQGLYIGPLGKASASSYGIGDFRLRGFFSSGGLRE